MQIEGKVVQVYTVGEGKWFMRIKVNGAQSKKVAAMRFFDAPINGEVDLGDKVTIEILRAERVCECGPEHTSISNASAGEEGAKNGETEQKEVEQGQVEAEREAQASTETASG